MKTPAPNPVTILNTVLLLLLIWLTLGNRQVGRGNAARLDSNRAVLEMEAAFQRRQMARIIQATVDRWQHLYGDNPQLRAREVTAADMAMPTPTPAPTAAPVPER